MSVGFNAGADVIELEPAKDNTLFSTGIPSSGGACQAICSGRTGPHGGNTLQRPMLAFDVAGDVPAGSTILSATLRLVLNQASPHGGPEVHTLHRLATDWGESTTLCGGGMGSPAHPDDATWLCTFYPDQFWSNHGGDFFPNASASQIVGTEPAYFFWGSTAQMVADVQSWLDEPSLSYGWLLKGNEKEERTAKQFTSREWLNPFGRPKLTIEYLPPPCPWDCADPSDGEVSVLDFLALVAQWGQSGASCDLDGGGVSVTDFLQMLAHWGPCP
jgi:hypothetical protein